MILRIVGGLGLIGLVYYLGREVGRRAALHERDGETAREESRQRETAKDEPGPERPHSR